MKKTQQLVSYPIIVETDSSEIASLINRTTVDLTELKWVVDDILYLMDYVGVISVSKVGRVQNECAHSLSKQSVEVARERGGVEHVYS